MTNKPPTPIVIPATTAQTTVPPASNPNLVTTQGNDQAIPDANAVNTSNLASKIRAAREAKNTTTPVVPVETTPVAPSNPNK